MKRCSLVILLVLSLLAAPINIHSQTETNTASDAVNITSTAAVLIEGSTGEIIYEKDKDKELIPASITKIMTLILVFEAIDSGKIKLEDNITVSEYAASMGGSQVFLEPGETQTVNDMIKCISIASANDASVAMAEKIAGSEQEFVKRMNEKAASLGMVHTQFKNCTGLDDNIESGHFSSAYDVALMSRELITKHPQISNYSTVWMDTITHTTKKGSSEFGLTNTNKLVRFYKGITGLKTGSTSKAKYCLSASAKRNDMDLIAVVMAAPDYKVRFSEASSLLDYGFAKCSVYTDNHEKLKLEPVKISGGVIKKVECTPEKSFSHTFLDSADTSQITNNVTYNETIKAPLKKGAVIGKITYMYENKELGSVNLVCTGDIDKASYTDYLMQIIGDFFLQKN